MDIGQQIIIGLSGLLGVWFVLAAAYNRRRGTSTYRWLQAGLDSIGRVSEAKWIGSSGSGARLVVARAEPPFRRVEMVFLLESREILPLWLFNHFLRGRRDLLILKADLRGAPSGELHLRRGGSTSAPEAGAPPDGGYPAGLTPTGRIRHPDHWRAALSEWLEIYGASVRQISIARASPHIILEIYLPQLTVQPGTQFFDRFKDTVARLA